MAQRTTGEDRESRGSGWGAPPEGRLDSTRDAARAAPRGRPTPWQVVVRTVHAVNRHHTASYASAIAYSALFAIFPFLLVLASLLAFLPIPHLMDLLLGLVAQLAPPAAIALVRDTIQPLVTRQHGELLSLGLVGAIWAAAGGVLTVMQAFNNILGARETRPFWLVQGVAILLALGVWIFTVTSLVMMWFGSYVTHWRTVLGPLPTMVWSVARWPLVALFLITAVNLLYFVAPTVRRPWRWFTPGAVFAVIGWMAASLGFSAYVAHFGSYDKTYGSIGTVILLLSWIWLAGLFLLLGFELNLAQDARPDEPRERVDAAAEQPANARRESERPLV